MVIYYVETSALVKRYKTEHGSEVVDELFGGKSGDDVITASQFAAVEIEATLSRALKAGILKAKAYDSVLGLFSDDPGEIIVIQPI
ncbi:MAG: hypothetical protein HY673_13700 [Chloroflexi bacterium]|nr:hypothetical protein [Chloroflexota bacterium]